MKKLALAAAMVAVPWSVQAADLGGNCCADLDERIAELEATTARKGNRKVSLEVSGHVNEAIFFHDVDGHDRPNWSIIPNSNSVTRFRFKGSAKMSPEWSAGFLLEIGAGGFDDDGASHRNLATRHSALYIKSKVLGTLWLGHTSVATDGVANIDLSRSSIASTPLAFAPADGALFGASFDVFDGGRREVVKWTSVDLGGFAVSASVSNENAYDIALRYAGEFGSIRIAAGAGWRHDEGPLGLGADVETIAASGSIHELRSGLFASASYGQVSDFGMGDLKGWAVRGGVENKIAAGVTATAFAEGGRYEIDTESLDMYGGGLVFGFGAFDVYGSLRHYEFGDETINVGVIGAKISF